jgi:hypothetical protein
MNNLEIFKLIKEKTKNSMICDTVFIQCELMSFTTEKDFDSAIAIGINTLFRFPSGQAVFEI